MTQDQQHGSDVDNHGDRRVLQNEHLRIEVLPALGGKLGSIVLGDAFAGTGGELLQSPLRPYAARTADLPFDQVDASGWDECLPSIGPCTVSYGEGQHANIEDHGDFWRLGFVVDETSDTLLRMHASGTSLPLDFERTIRLDGPSVHFGYTVRNRSSAAIPYGWSVHPLLAVERFDRVHLPASVREVAVASSADGRLGAPGSRHPWPLTTSALDGEALDLSVAGSSGDGVADKLIQPSPAEGWVALERRTLRARLTLRFDPKQAPWLGLWLCYGGWPGDAKAKKGYTVALEPCTLPSDSLAESLNQGAGAQLGPNEENHWGLQLEVSAATER